MPIVAVLREQFRVEVASSISDIGALIRYGSSHRLYTYVDDPFWFDDGTWASDRQDYNRAVWDHIYRFHQYRNALLQRGTGRRAAILRLIEEGPQCPS